MVEAIEHGFPQREIAESAYRFQQAVERKEKVDRRRQRVRRRTDEPPIQTLYIDERGRRQADRPGSRRCARRATTARVARRRSTRCGPRRVGTDEPDAPHPRAVRAYATVGEMCDALRDVWGEYEEMPVI